MPADEARGSADEVIHDDLTPPPRVRRRVY
jgi:hypothetical protein